MIKLIQKPTFVGIMAQRAQLFGILVIIQIITSTSASGCSTVTMPQSRSITMESTTNFGSCAIAWNFANHAEVVHKSQDGVAQWQVTEKGDKVAYTTSSSSSEGDGKIVTMFDCVDKTVAFFKRNTTLLEAHQVALLVLDSRGRYVGFVKRSQESFFGPTVYTMLRCPSGPSTTLAHCDGSKAAESQVVGTLEQQQLSLQSTWEIDFKPGGSGLLAEPALVALLCMNTYSLADRCKKRTVAAVSGSVIMLLCLACSCCGAVYAVRVYRRRHMYSPIQSNPRGTCSVTSKDSDAACRGTAEQSALLREFGHATPPDGMDEGDDDLDDVMDF